MPTMKVVSFHLLLFLNSCSPGETHELIGTWKVKDYTIWEKGIAYFKGVRSFIYGHELTLNPDSTYNEHSCGNIFAGRWTVSHDSLILSCDTMWYRKDYDYSKANLRKSKTVFEIRSNKLLKINSGEAYTIQDDGSKKVLNGFSMTILK